MAAQPLPAATPPPVAPKGRAAAEANLLLLDVRLDGTVLSDSLTAYQDGPQILLPLGELARLLTLAITVQPETGSASGYILREDNPFGLNVEQAIASIAGRETSYEARRARVIGDDIYISSQLLSRWLPIDFEIDLPSLQLRIKPREKLPLQARLERERTAAHLRTTATVDDSDPGYPRQLAPYQLIDRPFIDQTFGADARFGNGSRQYNTAYTAYLTADVLGMEGAAYISATRDKSTPDSRVTLGRNDPDAGLLGPAQARSFMLGNIQAPSVPNILSTNPTGSGGTVSNRRLDQPTSFDRQSLRGDLPPGWDVTLYYNDAVLGFQQSRGDGLYAFDDLPLSYGRNDFQLVFNGPLGQMRTERKSFLLDQSAVQPGEFLYTLTQHTADNGSNRSVAKFDMGLFKELAATATFVRLPRPVTGQSTSEQRAYSQFGLRGYLPSAIITSDLILAQNGGLLGELGLKTQLGTYAVDLLHTQLQDGYDSDVFSASNNPIRQRDKVRAVGTLVPSGLPRMPVALEVQREQLQSGVTNDQVSGRLSFLAAGTSYTNGLSWLTSSGAGLPTTTTTTGTLQLSRRVADMGLSGQLGYSLNPESRFDTLSVVADRNLASGYRVNAGLLRDFTGNSTLISGGLSKNLGPIALAVSGSYSDKHEYAIALQLFMALGRDARSGKWFADGVPMAGTGAVSAQAFVDRNLNGIHDPGEEWVPNAGFIVNRGGRHPNRTDDTGEALLNRLPAGRYADIGIDTTTLEDPQWKPVTEGVRVLPRPGLVQTVEFPVVSTTDIDGTTYLVEKGSRRGIGDVLLELVDSSGAVTMRTRSASDGFYTLHQVMPGRYTLRVSPEQVQKLRLVASKARRVEVQPDGDFLNGLDLELQLPTP